MIQRVFDVENEKDMADLWDILPDNIIKLTPYKLTKTGYDGVKYHDETGSFIDNIIAINWHDKTEITRPIQEATKDDIGKLCYFGDVKPDKKIVGLLGYVDSEAIRNKYMLSGGAWFEHCRRMTKQEIEELC